jgi:hemoglobin
VSSAADAAPVVDGRRDIAGRDDIDALLADFYGRAFRDDLLGPVFVDIAQMDLSVHLPVIGDFWQTVLFRDGSYRRNTLAPHQLLHEKAGLTPAHFDQWLTLWRATVDDRHAGRLAELAKRQGARVANAMCRRITGTDSQLLRDAVQRMPLRAERAKSGENRA